MASYYYHILGRHNPRVSDNFLEHQFLHGGARPLVEEKLMDRPREFIPLSARPWGCLDPQEQLERGYGKDHPY